MGFITSARAELLRVHLPPRKVQRNRRQARSRPPRAVLQPSQLLLADLFIFVEFDIFGFFLFELSSTSSTTSTIPSSFTYETSLTYQYLDPAISYGGLDWSTDPNVYESLLGYNGSCGSCVIPLLAQLTASPDLKTYNFTLRSGINFADGETLNSTDVYFSLNRLLIMDGSTSITHGSQAAWLIQQMLNTSLTPTCAARRRTIRLMSPMFLPKTLCM